MTNQESRSGYLGPFCQLALAGAGNDQRLNSYLSGMKLDVLAIGSHPDDVELGCSGTLIKEIRRGKKAGIIDLTQGELGTRGTIESRYQEAADAAQIMGI